MKTYAGRHEGRAAIVTVDGKRLNPRFDLWNHIFETSLSYAEAKNWTQLPPETRLLPRYREKFKTIGFEFGGSIMDVMRCACCPKDAKPDPSKAALKAGIVEILGDDEDAIVDAMEDCGV